MQIVFEHVGIGVPHSMEVLQGKPLRFEDLFRSGKAESCQQTCLELIIGHPVLLTAAYVICPVPEIFRYPVFADLSKQATRIFNRRPLQDAADRHMESSRINDLQNAWI